MKKTCKISNCMKRMIEYEALRCNISQTKLCNEIFNSFITTFKLNGEERGYMSFINTEYLLHITRKYSGIVMSYKYICIKMPKENYNQYINICKDFPKYKVRLFELACFYYFNILPPELRPTY